MSSPRVDILATSSSESTGTGSPTLLNPETSLHDTRTSPGSTHATLSVKFAPLPPVDPNRKRSLAPVGVSARLRRRRVIQQEGASLLWSTDPDVPEEILEDPVITLAKFIKKTGKTLWQRVRKGSLKNFPQEDVSCSAEPVLDISPTDCPALEDTSHPVEVVGVDAGMGMGVEDTRDRRATWSPPAARGTLSWDKAKRNSTTSDLSSTAF